MNKQQALSYALDAINRAEGEMNTGTPYKATGWTRISQAWTAMAAHFTDEVTMGQEAPMPEVANPQAFYEYKNDYPKASDPQATNCRRARTVVMTNPEYARYQEWLKNRPDLRIHE